MERERQREGESLQSYPACRRLRLERPDKASREGAREDRVFQGGPSAEARAAGEGLCEGVESAAADEAERTGRCADPSQFPPL